VSTSSLKEEKKALVDNAIFLARRNPENWRNRCSPGLINYLIDKSTCHFLGKKKTHEKIALA
jgi:hypothetical protein